MEEVYTTEIYGIIFRILIIDGKLRYRIINTEDYKYVDVTRERFFESMKENVDVLANSICDD